MFAYCGNNPVLYADPSGTSFISSLVSEIKEIIRNVIHVAVTGIELAQMGFVDLSFESIRSCAETLNKYGIDTVEEKAHFFAQCAYETNRGMWLTELGDSNYFADKPYGMKYRGAGYIQLTWDYNYKAFAEAMGDPEIYNQGAEYVAENYAWEAAGWFWWRVNMNERIANGWTVADVTRKVKGSYQGWWYRQQYYDEFFGILS